MGRGMVGRLRAYDSECKQEGEEAQELKERLATLQANIGGLAIIGGLQGQGQQRARGGAGAALGGGGER